MYYKLNIVLTTWVRFFSNEVCCHFFKGPVVELLCVLIYRDISIGWILADY